MVRRFTLSTGRAMMALAGSAAVLAGCTMCPDPYDYSGPVPNGSAPQNDFRARSNGIAPIGAVPRPWPPIVRQEADADGPVIAAAGEPVGGDVEIAAGAEADPARVR
ncbi:MAG: hypothetical protein ACKO1M_08560 [Planctomycetota bacterium]